MDEPKSKIPPSPHHGRDPFLSPRGVRDDEERPHMFPITYPTACSIKPYSTVIPRAITRNYHDRPPRADRVGQMPNPKAAAIVNNTDEGDDVTPHQTIAGLYELPMRVDPSSRDETVTDDSEGSVGWVTGSFTTRNSVTEDCDNWLNNPLTR